MSMLTIIIEAKYYQALVVSPKTPREVAGLYWGYDIRMADSISKVFTHSPYPVSLRIEYFQFLQTIKLIDMYAVRL